MTHDVDSFLPKKIADCKIAYIITASKKVDRTAYVERHKKSMDDLHRNYTEIDIADKSEEELKKILVGYDIVLMEGGNTFYLLKAIRESGFESVIKSLIAQGVVYIGSSAGAYVACPSIVMAAWSNNEFDRCGIVDYTAMNLVPFLIKAHYTLEKRSWIEENVKLSSLPTKVLDDNQALIIDNLKVAFIGEGDEIIL